jgi:hypothetical protein
LASEFGEEGPYQKIQAEMSALKIEVNILYLEGPQNVRLVTADIIDSVNSEYIEIKKCYDKHKGEAKRLISFYELQLRELERKKK